MKLLRSPLFWIISLIAAASAARYSIRHYADAFPVLDQTVTMDRSAAVGDAQKLAAHYRWRPGHNPQPAAMLALDSNLTNFIELEAGGKENLGRLIRAREIQPTRWNVRLFRERDASETVVTFSPDGEFLGFNEKLPDAETGPALATAPAREMAEKAAAAMGFSLEGFTLVASADTHTSSGRLDHSFTYERPAPNLGAGRLQRVLIVRADRFCGFWQGVKIPDEFFRRFDVMRASNKNLSLAAGIAVLIVLGLGGLVGGLIYLARTAQFSWRGPILLAVFVAGCSALNGYSQTSIAWFNYDTALSASVFQTRLGIGIIVGGLSTLVLALAYVTGEGLARAAFPHHPRLWAIFSPAAAGSRPIFGAVAGAYVLCVLMFGYEVAMNFIGMKHLGWWTPSHTLFDPGLLSLRIPWVTPFVQSLVAGTMEECVFRALPLAGAVLLARKFGRPALWIGGMLLLQALIFGSAHSNYPTMPGWARMTEMFVPSLVFGLLFLQFGLLPGILMHFLYDVLCMGLPLLSARTNGSALNVGILALLALVPLVWVTACRLRTRRWSELPDALRNAAWRPRTGAARPELPTPRREELVSTRTLAIIAGLGLVALVAWGIRLHTPPDMPGLSLRKAEAIQQARTFLAEEHAALGADWKALAVVQSGPDQERLFIWQTAGEATFHRLLGTYLDSPAWRVRFVRDTIPLPDRAEEHTVSIAGNGSVQWYSHHVPEPRVLPTLSKAEAQALAEREVRRIYQREPSTLQLVVAQEIKQPKRSDWTFVWKDPAAGLARGEARIRITLAGDALNGFDRAVFVPEEWEREKRAEANARNLTAGVISFVGGMGAVVLLAGIVRHWKQRPFAFKPAIVVGIAAMVAMSLQVAIKLPERVAAMPITETLQVQATRFVLFGVFSSVVTAVFLAAFVGLGSNRTVPASRRRAPLEFLAGLGLGFMTLLTEKFVSVFHPHLQPWHGGIEGANTPWPYLGGLWVGGVLLTNSVLFFSLHRSLHGSVRSPALRTLLIALFGLLLGATAHTETWSAMSLSAALFAIALVALDRLARVSHPSVVIAFLIGRALDKSLSAFILPAQPDAWGEGIVTFLVVGGLGALVFWALRPSEPAERTEAVIESEPKAATAATVG